MSGVLNVSTTAVIEVAPTAKVTIPNTPIDVKVEQSTAKERNIKFTSTAPVFFAAAAGRVTIQISSTADEAIPLSSSKTVKFSAAFAGEVNLKRFDTGNSTVTLTISPELSVASKSAVGDAVGSADRVRPILARLQVVGHDKLFA